MKISRRRFGKLIGTSILASKVALAAEPDYTLAVIPDTQYLAYLCGPAYKQICQWIVNNVNVSQGGVFTTNIKAVLHAGDVTHYSGTGEFANAQTAHTLLDAAGIPWVACPGNHDYNGAASTTDRSTIAPAFSSGGYFGADARHTANYGSLPNGGGSSYWGGSYNTANYYIRLKIGSKGVLLFSLENLPSAAALQWARSVADSYPKYESIVVTHTHLNTCGDLSHFPAEPGHQIYNDDLANSGAGLCTSQSVSDSNFNSGYGQWNNYYSTWNTLTMVLNGHWKWYPWQTGPAAPWLLQYVPKISGSSSAQTVHCIFDNWQEVDVGNYSSGQLPGGGGTTAPGNYCNPYSTPQSQRVGHVLLLQFRPSVSKLEAYSVATTSGLWEPSQANNATSPTVAPQLLFSVNYTGMGSLQTGLWMMPSPVTQ